MGSFQAVEDPMQARLRATSLGSNIIHGAALARTLPALRLDGRSLSGSPLFLPCPCVQRYKQLLFYATKLEALPVADHIPANKVKGCVSQVWVVPVVGEAGRIQWKADSDSQLTKASARVAPGRAVWFLGTVVRLVHCAAVAMSCARRPRLFNARRGTHS